LEKGTILFHEKFRFKNGEIGEKLGSFVKKLKSIKEQPYYWIPASAGMTT